MPHDSSKENKSVAIDWTREVLIVSGLDVAEVESVTASLWFLLDRVTGSELPSQDESVLHETLAAHNAARIVRDKLKSNQFDVFLCYHSPDKRDVIALGTRLKEKGYLPWLDEWNLQPGLSWQESLDQQIANIRATAICVGESGVGPWQDMEIEAFLRQFVSRKCPVIPVILPSCRKEPELPLLLSNMQWVDFRKLDPDPVTQLIWGITGSHPFAASHLRR